MKRALLITALSILCMPIASIARPFSPLWTTLQGCVSSTRNAVHSCLQTAAHATHQATRWLRATDVPSKERTKIMAARITGVAVGAAITAHTIYMAITGRRRPASPLVEAQRRQQLVSPEAQSSDWAAQAERLQQLRERHRELEHRTQNISNPRTIENFARLRRRMAGLSQNIDSSQARSAQSEATQSQLWQQILHLQRSMAHKPFSPSTVIASAEPSRTKIRLDSTKSSVAGMPQDCNPDCECGAPSDAELTQFHQAADQLEALLRQGISEKRARRRRLDTAGSLMFQRIAPLLANR